MKNKLIFLSFILILLACSKQPNKVIPESISRQSFADSSSLIGEFIEFNEPINNPFYFYITNDSLVVVVKGSADPYYVEIYNLHDKNHIQNIAIRGKGPNEFLSAIYIDKNSNDNIFILKDVVKSEFYFYNIDSILNGNPKPFSRIKAPSYTHDCDILNQDTLVCFNHFYFENEQFSNSVKPLFYLNRHTNSKNQSDEGLTGKYYTANVNSSFVYVSPINNRILLFNRHIDHLKIFNKKLELKRIINGPEFHNPKYKLKTGNHVSFKEGFYQSYQGICTTDSAVFALFNPLRKDDNMNKPGEIFKFDWDGNLLHRYKLDKYIFGISVDGKGKYLYGAHEKNFGEYPKLIKYKLN